MAEKIIKLLFAFVFAFLIGVNSAFCTPFKINSMQFDNSDKVIILKTTGQIDSSVQITKGTLMNPDRVYFDIPNAILTTPSNTFTLTNSMIEEATISQFTISPDIVRVVLKYKKNKAPKDYKGFNTYVDSNLIAILYNDKLVLNKVFVNIYGLNHDDIFAPLKSQIKEKEVQLQTPQTTPLSMNQVFEKNSQKLIETKTEQKLMSGYYIESLNKVSDGILLKGLGTLSIKPTIFLENPKRMIIDIENAVLKPELRNKTYAIGSVVRENPDNLTLAQREILRIAQFDKNIVRVVIQGENCRDYRAVMAPDRQNLYIANRQNVINSKLTNHSAAILKYEPLKENDVQTLLISFDAPVATSIFEENNIFYLDIQNVSDINQASFDALVQDSYFQNTKTIRIASDKLRIQKSLEKNVRPNVQITQDGKKIKIIFKVVTPSEKNENMIEDVKLILQNKEKKRPALLSSYYKVVIDAGHGGEDNGAIRDGINEKTLNLKIAKLVKKNLEKEKIHVKMTRDSDKFLELEERVEFSEKIKPDAFISIHHNASVKEDIYGIETHWYRPESLPLAERVHKELTSDRNLKNWDTLNRGLFKSQFYVINHTTSPAVLVEVGFISNKNEQKNLLDEKRQEEIAKEISNGIIKYLKNRGKNK